MKELKYIVNKENKENGEIADDAFFIKGLIVLETLLSWFQLVKIVQREINVLLHRIHTRLPYKQARMDYIETRLAEYEAKKYK